MWSVAGTLGHVVSNHSQRGWRWSWAVWSWVKTLDTNIWVNLPVGNTLGVLSHIINGKINAIHDALKETTGSSLCGTFLDSAPCISSLGFFNLHCFTVMKYSHMYNSFQWVWWILAVNYWIWSRCTTWQLWVKFYLGQNEDCSPGGSTSGSSERPLHRGSGGSSLYKVLVNGEFSAIKQLLYKRFSVSHKDLILPWTDLVLC